MRYATKDCDCPDVITGTGGKRPDRCGCGNRFQTEAELRSPAPAFPSVVGASTPKPRRRSTLKPGKGLSASPQQKKATKGRACIVCGKDEAEATIDPAHVTPRRMAPHCTCEKGTVPLCREHHDAYDQLGGGFDLLPYLMAHGLYEETVHGFLEHGVALREVMDVVTGEKWIPKSSLEPERSAAA